MSVCIELKFKKVISKKISLALLALLAFSLLQLFINTVLSFEKISSIFSALKSRLTFESIAYSLVKTAE